MQGKNRGFRKELTFLVMGFLTMALVGLNSTLRADTLKKTDAANAVPAGQNVNTTPANLNAKAPEESKATKTAKTKAKKTKHKNSKTILH